MKNKLLSCFAALVATGIMALAQGNAQNGIMIQFDSSKEVSGQKFALKDISPSLPGNWDGYNFVVLEARISTPQRFHGGFTTEKRYNELRVMSDTPNGWNKLAIPFKFYRALPDAGNELASTIQPLNSGYNTTGNLLTCASIPEQWERMSGKSKITNNQP